MNLVERFTGLGLGEEVEGRWIQVNKIEINCIHV